VVDTRRKVALYGLVRSQRERLLMELSLVFCWDCGWAATVYEDSQHPRDLPSSAWRAMLADIAARQYYAVVMFQGSPGLDEYCKQYDTHVAIISPDTSSAMAGPWRRVKVGR